MLKIYISQRLFNNLLHSSIRYHHHNYIHHQNIYLDGCFVVPFHTLLSILLHNPVYIPRNEFLRKDQLGGMDYIPYFLDLQFAPYYTLNYIHFDNHHWQRMHLTLGCFLLFVGCNQV